MLTSPVLIAWQALASVRRRRPAGGTSLPVMLCSPCACLTQEVLLWRPLLLALWLPEAHTTACFLLSCIHSLLQLIRALCVVQVAIVKRPAWWVATSTSWPLQVHTYMYI